MIPSIAENVGFLLDAPYRPFWLVVLAIALIVVGHITRMSAPWIFSLASMCTVAAFMVGFGDERGPSEKYVGFFVDNLSHAGLQLLLPALLMIAVMILQKPTSYHKKISSLLLLWISCFGAMVTLISGNWMMFFAGLQCLSLPIYGLLAFNGDDKMSIAASMRYVVLSFAGMAFLLFGILLIYAATGTMDLLQQSKILETMLLSRSLFHLGCAFILVGVLFKLSIFPFHVWAPEVYQGAPLFVIGFMVAVVKGVVVLFFMRAFQVLNGGESDITTVISVLAIMSMWLGNGLMLHEKNFVRILAYLSIAHLGYLMIPIIAQSTSGMEAIFLDISAFGLAILMVLISLKMLSSYISSPFLISDFYGLIKKYPWPGFSLAMGLVSIAGFPLTAGFVGKYAVFAAGVEGELWHLTAHMVLSSVLGFFVIAKLLVYMLSEKARGDGYLTPMRPAKHYGFVLAGALALLSFGIMPEPWVAWAKNHTRNKTGVDEKFAHSKPSDMNRVRPKILHAQGRRKIP